MKDFHCAETYDSNYRIIQEKLKAIGRLVQEHKKEFDKTDWGYVGDLDNCISKLDDIIDFLKNEG
jgi:hypothetical protein